MKRKLFYLCTTMLALFLLTGNVTRADDSASDEYIQQILRENNLLLEDGEFPADIIPPSDEDPNIPYDPDEASDPARVFGTDNRVYIQNTNKDPYNKVVFLTVHYSSKIGVGTGVLIAPNKVLTAAHVIRDKDTNEWGSYVTAYPGWNNGTYNLKYGGITGSTFHVFTSYKNNLEVGYTNGKVQNDLAVVTLPHSFPSDLGYLSVVNNIQVQQRTALIGYPNSDDVADNGKRGNMYAASGPILNIEENLVRYQIDMTKGQSGGPLLNSANQIVAINIAENSSRNTARRINASGLALVNAGLSNRSSGNGVSNLKVAYRLYHSGERYHFYTSSVHEKDTLVRGGWIYEGLAWRTDTGGTPVHRVYSPVTKRHLYTTNVNEKDTLVKRGWKYEGVVWHSMGAKNVYRLYHSGLKVHLYTVDENEKNVLSTRGWKYEGVAWKVE